MSPTTNPSSEPATFPTAIPSSEPTTEPIKNYNEITIITQSNPSPVTTTSDQESKSISGESSDTESHSNLLMMLLITGNVILVLVLIVGVMWWVKYQRGKRRGKGTICAEDDHSMIDQIVQRISVHDPTEHEKEENDDSDTEMYRKTEPGSVDEVMMSYMAEGNEVEGQMTVTKT